MRRFLLITAFGLASVWLMLSQTNRQRGIDFYQNRKFSEAIQEFQSYLSQNPRDFQIRLLLGLSLQQTGKLDEAAQALQGILNQQPQNGNATYALARIQYLRGQLTEAARLTVQASRMGAPKAGTLHLQGLIAKEQQQDQRALQLFTDARKADRNYIPAYLSSSEILLQQNKPLEALPLLNEAIRKAPGADGFYLRSRTYLAMNRRNEALDDLRKCIEAGGGPQAESLYRRLQNISSDTPTQTTQSPVIPVTFEETAEKAGLVHSLINKTSGEKYLIETMAGGVATFDFNGDGLVDIFFTNGADIPSFRKTNPSQWNRLYQNEGNFQFRDVTEQMRVAGDGFSTGVTVGDFNGDGRPDFFVSGYGKSLLYRNDGTHFSEISTQAGLKQQPWPITAGWFDYDNDGHLDLLIVNYLDWSPTKNIFCGDSKASFRVYCHPKHFAPLSNVLYRNRGDGTFEDVTEKSGLSQFPGKGMSVAFADYDNDGWQDIFITNDAIPNSFFRNRGNGTFEEIALTAGVALTDDGAAISSMGVDFRDYDNDGLPDLAITALVGETFPLFRNMGKGVFTDWSIRSQLAKVSKPFSGWGIHLADLNNDGWKDIFTANSHVTDNIESFSSDVYLLPNSVFLNRSGIFEIASIPFFHSLKRAHRGSAIADFDNDGRLDIVVSVLGGKPELWRNTSERQQNWIQIQLEGGQHIGAVITVDGQSNIASSTAGYASSSSIPVHFGLGPKTTVDQLIIQWPDGTKQQNENLPANQIVRIKKKATVQ